MDLVSVIGGFLKSVFPLMEKDKNTIIYGIKYLYVGFMSTSNSDRLLKVKILRSKSKNDI